MSHKKPLIIQGLAELDDKTGFRMYTVTTS